MTSQNYFFQLKIPEINILRDSARNQLSRVFWINSRFCIGMSDMCGHVAGGSRNFCKIFYRKSPPKLAQKQKCIILVSIQYSNFVVIFATLSRGLDMSKNSFRLFSLEFVAMAIIPKCNSQRKLYARSIFTEIGEVLNC